ncbi:MAG: hypothetical protein KDA41_21170 [Planctomycetales bacterium]|nr:hypothetical protein [Planctomycetales bacterium]
MKTCKLMALALLLSLPALARADVFTELDGPMTTESVIQGEDVVIGEDVPAPSVYGYGAPSWSHGCCDNRSPAAEAVWGDYCCQKHMGCSKGACGKGCCGPVFTGCGPFQKGCCASKCCPKICLPKIHLPQIHLPKISCCRPKCVAPKCCKTLHVPRLHLGKCCQPQCCTKTYVGCGPFAKEPCCHKPLLSRLRLFGHCRSKCDKGCGDSAVMYGAPMPYEVNEVPSPVMEVTPAQEDVPAPPMVDGNAA